MVEIIRMQLVELSRMQFVIPAFIFFQATNKSREDMRITLIIAVTEPSAVDSKAVAAELPYGSVTVEVRQGGLEVLNEIGDDAIVIANAAVLVCFEE